MKFSIIVASFDPGEKLMVTINSILGQDFQDFEILVKDGGSKDGTPERLRRDERAGRAMEDEKLKLIVKEDRGVYDGMNQALDICQGEYILFLNCGDRFHDRKVLACVAKEIDKRSGRSKDEPVVYYGNTYCMRTGAMVHSAPEITGFTCYRNVPCHQSCFYDRRLFRKKRYDIDLKIRADYDHFLWCFYQGEAKFQYLDLVAADYEGGGISERKENQKRDKEEHELVIRRYMGNGEILKYKGIMLLTLAPLRRWIAERSSLSGAYHRIKNRIYDKA